MSNSTNEPSVQNYIFFCTVLNETVPNNRFNSIEEYICALNLVGKQYKDAAAQGLRFKTVLIFNYNENDENSPTISFWFNDNMIYINILYFNSDIKENTDQVFSSKILQQFCLDQSEFIKSIKKFRGYCSINWIRFLSNVEEVQWKGTFTPFDDQKEKINQLNHPTLRKLMFCDDLNFNLEEVIRDQDLNELIMNVIDSDCINMFYNQMKQLSECKGIVTHLKLSFYGNSTLDAFLKYYKQQNDEYCVKISKLEIKIWGPHENLKDNNLNGLSTIFKANYLFLNFNGFVMPLDFQPTTIENLQQMCKELMSFETVEAPRLNLNFNPVNMKPYDLKLLYVNRHFFNISSLNIIEELMRQQRILVACSGLDIEKNSESTLAIFNQNNLFDRNLLPLIFQYVNQ